MGFADVEDMGDDVESIDLPTIAEETGLVTQFMEWFNALIESISNEDTENDDTDPEEKGIRHVRTPEGSRRYGLPIGAPIISDSAGNPISHAIEPHVHAPSNSNPNVRWEESWDGTRRSKFDKYTMEIHPHGSKFKWELRLPYQTGGGRVSQDVLLSGNSATEAAAKRAVENAAKKRRDEWQNRNPRDFDNLMDYWPGIPGYDYKIDNPDESPSDDEVTKFLEDPDYRASLAEQHTKSMGIRIIDDAHVPLEVNAHEMINATIQAHDDMFPGFRKLIGSIGTESMSQYGANAGRVLAYNGTRYELVDDDRVYAYQSMLRFNYRYFGDVEGVYENAARVSSLKPDDTWHSVDGPSFIDEYSDQLEPWLASMMQTTVHEIGHTLGNIALGQFGDQHGSERRNKAMQEMWDLFYNWGIVDEHLTEADFVREAEQNIHNGGGGFAPMALFNRGVIHEALSNYGASSIHEMFAESWAEYLLDPNPRDFSVAVGELLTEMMQDYLEAHQ